MKNSLTRLCIWFLAICFAAQALTACHSFEKSSGASDLESSSVPEPQRGLPPNLEISFRWAPSSVLDVEGPEWTFVRAYTESFELAFEGQSVNWGYPGFSAASPTGINRQVTRIDSYSQQRPVVKAVYFTPLRRDDKGETQRLVLCRSESVSVKRGVDQGREWRYFVDSWGVPVTIEFERSGDKLPPRRQQGQDLMPSRSVFGSWRTTFFEQLGLGNEGSSRDVAACESLPRNNVLPTVGSDWGPEPLPLPRPEPGWPARGV